MNYYRRYLGDYMRDTMHLSMMEHGAYNLLLDAYYATGKPHPKDYGALYRICRAVTKAEQEAVRRVADEFFKVGSDDLRHNPRADDEIGIAQSTIEKQRESGVNSAAKRWGQNGSTYGSAIQPPTTNHQPNKKENSSKKFDEVDMATAREMFSLILTLNPKHKEPSFEAWANDIRLIRERDGRTTDEIRSLFAWANGHDFWKTNILSPVKLREQWDKLTIQRNSKPSTKNVSGRKTISDYQSDLRTGNEPDAIPGNARRVV